MSTKVKSPMCNFLKISFCDAQTQEYNMVVRKLTWQQVLQSSRIAMLHIIRPGKDRLRHSCAPLNPFVNSKCSRTQEVFCKIVCYTWWIQRLGIVLTVLLIMLTFLNFIRQWNLNLIVLTSPSTHYHAHWKYTSSPWNTGTSILQTHSGGPNGVRCSTVFT